MTLIEKKWIAFQLLLALQQAHKHGVCHGDIKMENVMISSWNWVLLTDFASFKPTFLPEDNPAEFSYFFDTSRRRTCYIAPERFKERTISEAASNPAMSTTIDSEQVEFSQNGDLLASMDIFSAGCVLIELFTEGTPPFNFSQLLAYRAGEFSPDKVLDKIENEDVQTMLKIMIQKDPNARKSANEHLLEQRGQVFPDYFYTFLQSYMQIFSTDATMTSDNKINKIHENLNALLQKVDSEEFDVHGLTLICGVVTAHLRSLKFCGAKVKATEILKILADKVSSDIILDRILPFVITLLADRFPTVRIAAFHCITDCVQAVQQVPLADANIFPEYILPNLLPLCNDRNDLVRAAFASRIAEIAQESVRFLDLVMLTSTNIQVEDNRPMPSYDTELTALHDMISHAVSVLLADSANAVKQALMERSVTKLAIFFGKQKANDVILSHMITFLNDKEDAQLRLSFYENIVGVAAFVGWQCSPILLPLLQQGLSDPEEFVITRCINTMGTLTSLQLLQKVNLYELLKETTPYLLHPNLWIRQATADFVASTANILDGVDVVVKLGTILAPFLKQPVIQMNNPALILANVDSAIPRCVLDAIVRTPIDVLNEFMNLIEERQTARSISKTNVQVMYNEMSSSVKPLFRRLASDGMVPNVEDKLLYMKDNLLKISKHRAMKTSINDQDFNSGLLELSQIKLTKRSVPLDFEEHHKLSVGSEAVTDEALNQIDESAKNSPDVVHGHLEQQQKVIGTSPKHDHHHHQKPMPFEAFPDHLGFTHEISPTRKLTYWLVITVQC